LSIKPADFIRNFSYQNWVVVVSTSLSYPAGLGVMSIMNENERSAALIQRGNDWNNIRVASELGCKGFDDSVRTVNIALHSLPAWIVHSLTRIVESEDRIENVLEAVIILEKPLTHFDYQALREDPQLLSGHNFRPKLQHCQDMEVGLG
jgi:hypothetical protein